jgi:hypothetical protein
MLPVLKGVQNHAMREGSTMPARPFLGALLCLLPGITLADPTVPVIPNTPAGRALASWLEVFNSGDSARMDSFDQTHVPWLSHDRAMGLLARTGGFDLENVEKSDRLWVMFRAREKTSSKEVLGRLVVMSDNPAVINWMSFEAVSPGGNVQEITLDAAERERVIESAAKLLDERYVFPDVGKKLSAALRKAERRGTYRAITDGQILAWRLSDDLWAIAHDGHLGVRFSKEVLPPDEPGQGPDTDPAARRRLLSSNCGFEKVEHLRPNIGYVKFNMFADPGTCAPTAVAAMNFVADSDALILDLRDNNGGAPEMVALICSYLFEQPTHLNDLYNPRENTTVQSWTLPYVPGKRFTERPVFVLVSKRTFSGAEEFSYDLKNLKRATLIGETTGGGAHLVTPHRMDDHFSINVPEARGINPITKTDWERVGVEPDIKVAAADALDEALKRARGP